MFSLSKYNQKFLKQNIKQCKWRMTDFLNVGQGWKTLNKKVSCLFQANNVLETNLVYAKGVQSQYLFIIKVLASE